MVNAIFGAPFDIKEQMMKVLSLAAAIAALAATAVAEDDPYLWLEEVESEKALDWVRGQNARSLAVLENDPRFDALYQDALSILNSKERLALGEIHNGQVYNFWQDEAHVRGLWRRSDVQRYKDGDPEWDVLIDFDRLAETENRNWIRGDTQCLSPDYRHCMIEVSDGGKDAAYWREFDTVEKTFVDGGFSLDEAKSGVAWLDADTLIVGTDWGEGSLTTSGYPRVLRLMARGGAATEAPVVFEGEESDVSVGSSVYQDDGVAHVFVTRFPSFFEREYHYAKDGVADLKKLPLPPNADLQGVFKGAAIFFLREPWSHGGSDYAQGAVIAYDPTADAAELVFEASEIQSVEDVAIGKSNIIIQYLEHVAGKAARLSRKKKGGWKAKEIALPKNGVVSIVSTGGGSDDALISFESLTTPDTLYFVSSENKVKKISAAPEFYDASDVVVEQRFATSADGTEIPYFLMAREDVLKKGDAPTMQYGYGGFLAAILPVYYADPGRPQHGALAGKMWVRRGGVLVLSNIRGGSEYGPRWHDAALKENRQRSFDDFIAISEHLIETGVTSPEKLGAHGRSNGGLLMGAILTQRPDLYNAIDIGVPLFDMKRYNKLLAGASWMGEYGNPDIDEEWAYISQYSPYQNLAAGELYPEVLFYTSTKDDRVHPGHARKAAARLAELGYDFYYYENIEGGHGGTANQDQLAYRTALEYVYFARQLMGEEGEE